MAQGQAAVVSDPAGNIVTANGTSFLVQLWQEWLLVCGAFLPQNKSRDRELIVKASDRFSAP
jgi:hypothetical protein